jgi:predicted SprT family Zn-dependent metalloprotease
MTRGEAEAEVETETEAEAGRVSGVSHQPDVCGVDDTRAGICAGTGTGTGAGTGAGAGTGVESGASAGTGVAADAEEGLSEWGDGKSVAITWNNRLRKTAGLTFTRHGVERDAPRVARMELSSKVCDTPARMAATLLHEMCHVAAWLVDGCNRPPHGAVFNGWASAASSAYPHFKVTTTHAYAIRCKFTYVCQNAWCSTEYGRHSKSIDIERQRCGVCSGRLALLPPGKAVGGSRTAARACARAMDEWVDRKQSSK